MGKDGARRRPRRSSAARRPRPRRGRVDLHRLRHAARGGRGRPRRRVLPLDDLPAAIAREADALSTPSRHDSPPRAADDYVAFCEASGASAAIDLLQYKRGQMERRVRTFAQRRGTPRPAPSTAAACAATATSSTRFLDRVTINVSQLWRHPEQFDVLAQRRSCPSSRRAGRIRAWSAGCSYGAEAYTLAAVCRAAVPRRARRDHRHRHRHAHGRARPRRASSPPRTPAASPPALLRRAGSTQLPDGGWRGEARAARDVPLRDRRPAAHARSRARALRPRLLPQHRHLLHRRGARRAARAPRRRRCAPGGYLVVGTTERVADPRRARPRRPPTPSSTGRSDGHRSEYLPMFLAEAPRAPPGAQPRRRRASRRRPTTARRSTRSSASRTR